MDHKIVSDQKKERKFSLNQQAFDHIKNDLIFSLGYIILNISNTK
jgi:hypothetical protein